MKNISKIWKNIQLFTVLQKKNIIQINIFKEKPLLKDIIMKYTIPMVQIFYLKDISVQTNKLKKNMLKEGDILIKKWKNIMIVE